MRKKKDLIKEIEELKKQNEKLQETINGERIFYRTELRSKQLNKLEKVLKEYSFAILTDGHTTRVWNDGRWESRIRNIHFSHYEHDMKPEITIEK